MQHVGWGVFVRDSVHVSDVRTCINASRLCLTSKGWVRLQYMKRIISALTGRRAWSFQIPLINKLMIAAGFKQDAEGNAEDAIASLDRVCNWIGVRINKTREEVANFLTIDEVSTTVMEIMKRDLELALNMVKAHHLPEKFTEEIVSEMKRLTSEVKETKREVHKVKAELNRYGKEKHTLASGFLQPC